MKKAAARHHSKRKSPPKQKPATPRKELTPLSFQLTVEETKKFQSIMDRMGADSEDPIELDGAVKWCFEPFAGLMRITVIVGNQEYLIREA